jgi:hypothetical protein
MGAIAPRGEEDLVSLRPIKTIVSSLWSNSAMIPGVRFLLCECQ